MKDNENIEIFERFLSPKERGKATNDLASNGRSAVPILQKLFNGEAKNKNGIEYRKIGALGCGYVTVRMLGDIAKSLEKYMREGIKDNHAYAIEAVDSFSSIEKETIIALAESLNTDIASDAASSLVKCGEQNNSIVQEILKNNKRAIERLNHVENYIKKNT